MSPAKILVVEDEVLIAEHIKDYLNSFGLDQVLLVHNKNHALQAIDHIKPDLVLLDIHLENPLDGIELAKLIDERGQSPYIFITANADMLIIKQATHTKAAAYITKPIKKSDLFAAVQIALKSIDSKEVKFLQVKDNGSIVRIPQADILYIESNGNYINIHTKAQKILSRQSLDWVQEQLPEHQFLRVHRSFIVNVTAVQRFTTRSLFIEETEIPVSRMNASVIAGFLKEPKI